VQSAIAYAIEHGVDASEFEGETAKDVALQILNLSSEPVLAESPEPSDEKADESAETPDGDQEAPDASVPESDEPGTEDVAKEAAAQIEALAAEGVLNTLGETIGHFQKALEQAIATRAENERLTAENASLTAALAQATENVQAAVQFVDKVMELPVGRKSVVRREAAGFAERLKDTPFSPEVLAYIQRHQGAS